MRAVVCERYGSPEVLKVRDVVRPEPNEDEILIRIHATTVNSGDVRSRALDVPGPMKLIMRIIMGWNRPRNPILGTVYAGVVEEVGSKVVDYQTGDKVFGATAGMSFGCHAEYVTVRQGSAMARIPDGFSFRDAAAAVFGGAVAAYFLEKVDASAGKSILVYGASGAVGTAAVQLAKARGLAVTGVASGKNEDLVRSLGADHFIDYTAVALHSVEDRYDLVFEAVGKADPREAKKLLMPGGANLTVAGLDMAKETAGHLELLSHLMAEGKFKPVIDRCYPLEEAAQAHRYVDEGLKRGNVVLEVEDSIG